MCTTQFQLCLCRKLYSLGYEVRPDQSGFGVVYLITIRRQLYLHSFVSGLPEQGGDASLQSINRSIASVELDFGLYACRVDGLMQSARGPPSSLLAKNCSATLPWVGSPWHQRRIALFNLSLTNSRCT